MHPKAPFGFSSTPLPPSLLLPIYLSINGRSLSSQQVLYRRVSLQNSNVYCYSSSNRKIFSTASALSLPLRVDFKNFLPLLRTPSGEAVQCSSVPEPTLRHLHAQQVAELDLRYVVGDVFLFFLGVSMGGFRLG